MTSAVKLGSHNDYIAQSQGCVVTLKGLKKQPPPDDSQVRIQKTTPVSADPVKVSLHDCLACSGCITTAETVMLEQQSTGELLSQLSDGKRAVVVSLSPQSRASLAAHYGLSPLQAFRKLTGFLKGLGVKAVFDTSCSRDLSLVESCAEFVERFRAKEKFPLLASSCPGWVCYAEKTHGDDVLPYISAVKSPQQAMGAILKRYAHHTLGLSPEDMYHVTIMPCYDKKLEAAREDFIFEVEGNNNAQTTEVDCVLTSSEILDLLQARNVDFTALEEAPLDKLLTNVDESGHLYGVQGGAGSYAETVFRYASRELFGREVTPEWKTLRNADFREASLEVEGRKALRFACVYGFRNIQNIVRQIKSGRCEYHFMEVMACPSGCLNGGGQIKPRKGQSAKELIQQLEGAYLNEVDVRDPFGNQVVKGLYQEWLGRPGSEVLRTQYHVREKTVASFVSDCYVDLLTCLIRPTGPCSITTVGSRIELSGEQVGFIFLSVLTTSMSSFRKAVQRKMVPAQCQKGPHNAITSLVQLDCVDLELPQVEFSPHLPMFWEADDLLSFLMVLPLNLYSLCYFRGVAFFLFLISEQV